MSEISRQSPFNYQYTLLKNEGQEGKTCLFWGLVPVRRRRHKERMKEGKYGGCTLYSCMKIE
jgi:hypothetical protein